MARTITFMQAINEAMAEEMRRDPSVFVMGEDVRVAAFGQTAGLVKEFGPERVVNTPICENAITGVAAGAAMFGLRPILELMFCDFAMLAMDELCNQIGQFRYVSGGQYTCPVTIRMATGAGFRMAYGHSQSLQSQLIQAPGLVLVETSTPARREGPSENGYPQQRSGHLLRAQEIAPRRRLGGGSGRRPHGSFRTGRDQETRQGRHRRGAGFHGVRGLAGRRGACGRGHRYRGDRPEDYRPPRQGDDLQIRREDGAPRYRGGRKVRGGIGAEIAALAASEYFDLLDAPVQRVAAPMAPVPGSPVLEDLYIPNSKSIVKAVKRVRERR